MNNYFEGYSIPLKIKSHKNIIILNDSDDIKNIKDFSLEDYASLLNINKSILTFYSSWFLLENGFYYYKAEYVFRELFMSEFVKEYKLKNVKYKVAKWNNEYGIISKNFRKQGRCYFDYDSYIEKRIQNDEIDNSLSRLLAFDFFTGQMDRGNYNLLFEKNKDTVSLSPLTDNGCCFSFNPYSLHSVIRKLFFPKNKKMNEEERETLELIDSDIEFKNYLIKSLDIDVLKILDRTIKKYNILINKYNKNLIIKYFDTKKEIIDNTLKLIK